MTKIFPISPRKRAKRDKVEIFQVDYDSFMEGLIQDPATMLNNDFLKQQKTSKTLIKNHDKTNQWLRQTKAPEQPKSKTRQGKGSIRDRLPLRRLYPSKKND